MARNTDFIGFTFNGRHSSEFNIYSVSDGSRYQDVLVPNPIDYTEQVPGGVGQYYFGSDMDIKEFPLSIAYDKLTETQVRELRNWLAPDAVGELIFDERPYKTYTGKISTSPSLSFICFDSYNKESGKKERVYKGEGSINFVCYYPLGVVSGEKKELNWYREQIDDKIYKTIGGNSPFISYKLDDKEIAVLEKIKGKTTEIGEGEKNPDNPYTLSGAKPTALTVCGKNLYVDRFEAYSKPMDYWICPVSLVQGCTYTLSASRTGSQIAGCTVAFATGGDDYAEFNTPPNQFITLVTYDGTVQKTTFTVDATFTAPVLAIFASDQAAFEKLFANYAIQLELGDAATPYEPYAGQSVELPEGLELYGAGEVCDEYDATSGMLTQRWERLDLDGTESWNAYISDHVGADVMVYTLTGYDFRLVYQSSVCSCFRNVNYAWQHNVPWEYSDHDSQVYKYFTVPKEQFPNVSAFKAWLAEQNAAGTPVTVVYQLAAPVVTKIEEVSPFSSVSSMNDSNLIMNINPEHFNYFTDSAADISLRIYGAKYANVDEWSVSSGMLNDLNTTGVNVGYDHYITLPDGSKGIQLYNPGDKETDFILSFNKPKPMNDIKFTLSDGQQFVLNLRSDDTDVEKYGAVSDEEKQVAQMTGGVITIDTKKNRIMYKYGAGTAEAFETSIYFALKEGQFFKIPRNKTAQGGYNLVISADSYFDGNSIDIDYDYLYY